MGLDVHMLSTINRFMKGHDLRVDLINRRCYEESYALL